MQTEDSGGQKLLSKMVSPLLGLFEGEEMSYPGLRGADAPLHPGLLMVSRLRRFLNTLHIDNFLRRRRLTMLNPRL